MLKLNIFSKQECPIFLCSVIRRIIEIELFNDDMHYNCESKAKLDVVTIAKSDSITR